MDSDKRKKQNGSKSTNSIPLNIGESEYLLDII